MGLLDHVKIENLDEDQRKMVELVGLDGFKSLVRAFGGTTIYIPKAESLERAARDQKIREEFDGGNYRACREIWTYRALGEIYPVRKTG